MLHLHLHSQVIWNMLSCIYHDYSLNLVKVNLEEFKQEFREWRLSNQNAGTAQINAEYERLAGIYDAKLLAKLKGQLDPSSEQTDNNTEFINLHPLLSTTKNTSNFSFKCS